MSPTCAMSRVVQCGQARTGVRTEWLSLISRKSQRPAETVDRGRSEVNGLRLFLRAILRRVAAAVAVRDRHGPQRSYLRALRRRGFRVQVTMIARESWYSSRIWSSARRRSSAIAKRCSISSRARRSCSVVRCGRVAPASHCRWRSFSAWRRSSSERPTRRGGRRGIPDAHLQDRCHDGDLTGRRKISVPTGRLYAVRQARRETSPRRCPLRAGIRRDR